MHKRIDAARLYLSSACLVPIGVEQRMRVAPFRGTDAQIVEDRIDPRARHILVLREVPILVEDARALDQYARAVQLPFACRPIALEQDMPSDAFEAAGEIEEPPPTAQRRLS